jgi:hypothetical protein
VTTTGKLDASSGIRGVERAETAVGLNRKR